jgi:hypothetical protein
MLKQLEVYVALRPRVVVPAHGPVGDVRDLETMVDYLLLARQKVRVMMEQGLGLPDIVARFDMNEFKGWDRGSHFEWMAETIHRELNGLGPQKVEYAQAEAEGTIGEVKEEGRFFAFAADDGQRLRLRVASDTNIEGVPDRTQLRAGMRAKASYIVPKNFNPALGFDIMEIVVAP